MCICYCLKDCKFGLVISLALLGFLSTFSVLLNGCLARTTFLHLGAFCNVVLSPLLVIWLLEAFSIMLNREMEGVLKGFKVGRSNWEFVIVLHLLFIKDIISFYQA